MFRVQLRVQFPLGVQLLLKRLTNFIGRRSGWARLHPIGEFRQRILMRKMGGVVVVIVVTLQFLQPEKFILWYFFSHQRSIFKWSCNIITHWSKWLWPRTHSLWVYILIRIRCRLIWKGGILCSARFGKVHICRPGLWNRSYRLSSSFKIRCR
jgi:hypothetical protein